MESAWSEETMAASAPEDAASGRILMSTKCPIGAAMEGAAAVAEDMAAARTTAEGLSRQSRSGRIEARRGREARRLDLDGVEAAGG